MSSVSKAPRLNLKRLKVRPRKDQNAGPCAAEMAAMLGCWASQGDDPNAAQCSKFAESLKVCMSTSVSLLYTIWLILKAKYVKPDNTINYHLARLGKLL